MKRAVHIPDLGDFHDVEVLEIVAKPGDILAPEAPIVTLESDKAAMDVPAPFAGKVLAIHIKAGDKVNQGDHVADLETDAAPDEAAPPAPSAQSEPQKEPDSPAPAPHPRSHSAARARKTSGGGKRSHPSHPVRPACSVFAAGSQRGRAACGARRAAVCARIGR